MRTVKLTDCSYEKFNKIRDVIYNNIPFALIHIGYSPELKVAIFNFWDSDYIPAEMTPFIMQPPVSRENKQKMSDALADLFTEES
jgi:hypothetical protein